MLSLLMDWSQQMDVHHVALGFHGAMIQWPGPRMLPTTCSGKSQSFPLALAKGHTWHIN